jgi:hypothetical protein
MVSDEQLARARALIEFVEGVWGLELATTNPVRRSSRPWLRDLGAAVQETDGPGRGATAHVRRMSSSFAPPADGRRESAANEPAPAESSCTKSPCHGCKGEKPWHLGPDERPRERSVRDEKRTTYDGATPRRKRVWRTETVE